MVDIPGYEAFIRIEPLHKGWSSDSKYYVETKDEQRLLLRVSNIAEYDRKRAEYGMMECVYELGALTPRPVGFGICNGGKSAYSLSGWLDGEDAETVLPHLSEAEQYSLGMKAGEILRNIHTLPAPQNAEPWDIRFYRKVQSRVEFYNKNLVKSQSSDKFIHYLQDKRELLSDRPQTFCHGDYGTSNLIVMPAGQIGVIDFNYFNLNYGDPWWEFDSIPWGTVPSVHYHTGLIKGYFDGMPPCGFFEMLSYYFAYDALAALCDTSIGEQGEPEDGIRHIINTLRWFDDMRNPVPTWYLSDFHG